MSEVKVITLKKGAATVIEWNGMRYILDHKHKSFARRDIPKCSKQKA